MNSIGVRHPEAKRTVVHLEGRLDAGEADRLAAVSVGMGIEGPVAIDLHDALAVHDYALVRLARALAATAGRVTIVGLSEHHSRLLRYVGLGAIQAARRPAEDG